jgi:hypothetical protein
MRFRLQRSLIANWRLTIPAGFKRNVLNPEVCGNVLLKTGLAEGDRPAKREKEEGGEESGLHILVVTASSISGKLTSVLNGRHFLVGSERSNMPLLEPRCGRRSVVKPMLATTTDWPLRPGR